MAMWRRICVVLLATIMLFGMLPGYGAALTSEEIQKQIDELEAQEAQLQEQMQNLEEQKQANLEDMQAVVQQKNVVDQQIFLLQKQLANTEEQIAAFAQLIADQQEALDAAQADYDLLNETYRHRIRAMEEEGQLSYWSILFQANSFLDFLDRLAMVQEIAAADQKRLKQLNEAAQQVEQARDALTSQKQNLEDVRISQRQAQEELEAKRSEADSLLRQMVEKGEAFELLLQESEWKQEELMEQLAKAEQDYQEALAKEEAAKQPTVSEEGWLTPVASYVLTSPFGMRMHPILGEYRMHNGVDMACPAMTPIYASRSGVVSVASYQADGAGNYVQLNHGDGYRSIYMHMTYYTVSPGEYVEQGQVIGYVGNTGLSKGDHLHFGISYNGQYVNPMEYL